MKAIAMIGLLYVGCTNDKYCEKGNAPSLLRAYVIRPVTATLLKPAKNILITTSHARPAPTTGPLVRKNTSIAAFPVFPFNTAAILSVLNNNARMIPNPPNPEAAHVYTIPIGADVLDDAVSCAMCALASYPEKLYSDVRILMASTYDELENPESL